MQIFYARRHKSLDEIDLLHVDKDAIDEKALEKFNEWVSMAEGDFTREDCIRKGYDPEILNEFCFYPIQYWGRLIEWATEEEDPYEPSYQFKIIRASYILSKVDPSIIQFVNHEGDLDPNHQGPSFVLQVEEREVSKEEAMLLRRLNGMQSTLKQLNGFEDSWIFDDADMEALGGMDDMSDLLDMMGDGKMMF